MCKRIFKWHIFIYMLYMLLELSSQKYILKCQYGCKTRVSDLYVNISGTPYVWHLLFYVIYYSNW